MPLVVDVFVQALRALPPTTNATQARQNHATAFRTYMEGLVTIPPVLPPVHAGAAAAMSAALVGQELLPPVSIQAINNGYLAYIGVILASLAATPGTPWIVNVPPNPAGPISSAFVVGGVTIQGYAAAVHAWVTAIQGSVPPIPPTNWT